MTTKPALVERVLSGDKRAVARLITALENKHARAWQVLNELYPHTGQAHLVGITGPPGAGKSSLVNKLTLQLRRQGQSVAILAVDPTSPFSGGAILGDRVRMRELSGDAGVFIRSLASRGSLGGLSAALNDALHVLDAAGFEVILIETVGAGQDEVEIVNTAHTVVVVEAPGLGDEIQAIKAGILEIADIFVVNKADQPGVERAVSALKAMLGLGHPVAHHMLHHGQLLAVQDQAGTPAVTDWQIPVLKTIATQNEGIDAVINALNQHHNHLHDSGEIARRNRTRLLRALEINLQSELLTRLLQQLPPETINHTLDQLTSRKLAPHAAAKALVDSFLE